MLDATSISTVLDLYRPERALLIELLGGLSDEQWALLTECPEYDVKGIATHILGDDLSLLSRQRDAAESGLIRVAVEHPGASFMDLLNTFNDQWVSSAAFFSPTILIDLLRITGEWTVDYYSSVDPASDGEYVGIFGGAGPTSPFWQAIAREYLERWVHHSQIRRALDLGSLAGRTFVEAGVAVVATIANQHVAPPDAGGDWRLGEVVLGDDTQAADILTRRFSAAEVRTLAAGPIDAIEQLSLMAGRPSSP